MSDSPATSCRSSTAKDRVTWTRMTYIGAASLLLVVLVFYSSPGSKRTEEPIDNLHWSYKPLQEQPDLGDDWSDFLLCSEGKEQSPINIQTGDVVVLEEAETPTLEWNYSPYTLELSRLTEEYDNNVFEVTEKVKPSLVVNDNIYRLTEIELHAPSENAIDGKHFDLEVQFRHTAPGPKYMVVSVMFVKGEADPGIVNELATIVQNPTRSGAAAISFHSILETLNSTARGRYFQFAGSLSSPPCTEGVDWFILRDPIPALFFDIDEIAQDLSRNNRPVQELNERKVYVAGSWGDAAGDNATAGDSDAPAAETASTRAAGGRPASTQLRVAPPSAAAGKRMQQLQADLSMFKDVEKMQEKLAALNGRRPAAAAAAATAAAAVPRSRPTAAGGALTSTSALEHELVARLRDEIARDVAGLRPAAAAAAAAAKPSQQQLRAVPQQQHSAKAAPRTAEKAAAAAAAASALSAAQVETRLDAMANEVAYLKSQLHLQAAKKAAASAAAASVSAAHPANLKAAPHPARQALASVAPAAAKAAAGTRAAHPAAAAAKAQAKAPQVHASAAAARAVAAAAPAAAAAAALPTLPSLPALPPSASGELSPRPGTAAAAAADRDTLLAQLNRDEANEAKVIIELYQKRAAAAAVAAFRAAAAATAGAPAAAATRK